MKTLDCNLPFRMFATVLALSAVVGTTAHSAEGQFFDSDGVMLRYFDQGQGAPILLLHGFSGQATDSWNWEPGGLVESLLDSGYRVIAYDQRGHGESDKPHALDAYGMVVVEDVHRILNFLEIERVHLVGYSMGSRVVNKFRELYPERLFSVKLGAFQWRKIEEGRSEEALRERFAARGRLEGRDPRALAAISADYSAWDVSDQNLRDNKIPALALVGDEDELVTNNRELYAMMGNLELVVIPGGTHGGTNAAREKELFRRELLRFVRENGPD